MSSCIFCQIVAGTAPSHQVAEDERTLAFLDIFPVARGHTLVIPKAHGANLFETSADDLAAVARMTKRIGHAIRDALEPDGIATAQLNGAAAGQTVFHLHNHLIPRQHGDPMQLHSRVQGDADALAEVAAKLRAALD